MLWAVFIENTGTEKQLNSCRTISSLASPAKLNLGLKIVGRRPDGYHLIESVFWPITLGDRLVLKPTFKSEPATLTWIGTPPTPPIPRHENIAWRAMEKLFPAGSPFHLEIEKKIPLGGGLGGGSSNAATILRHFDRHATRSAEGKLADALSLGSDVPFFLQSNPAWVTGTGENVHPFHWNHQLNPIYFLLILLPNPTSTQAVFAQYRMKSVFSNPSASVPPEISDLASLRDYLRHAVNDLELPAGHVNSLIPRVLTRLRQSEARHAALSGSGSTCFAVFDDELSRSETDKALQPFCRENQCRTLCAETFADHDLR